MSNLEEFLLAEQAKLKKKKILKKCLTIF